MPGPGLLAKLILIGYPVERFPCDDHGCGCGSARECWTDCCCYSHIDRVAWAAEHDVPVPEYARVRLAPADASLLGPSCALCTADTGPDGGSGGASTGSGPGAAPLAARSRRAGVPTVSPLGCKAPGLIAFVALPPALTGAADASHPMPPRGVWVVTRRLGSHSDERAAPIPPPPRAC